MTAGPILSLVAFFALWVALVGTRQPLELLAGVFAAVLAGAAAGLVARLRLPSPLRAHGSWRLLGGSVARIIPDTALVLTAIAHRRRGAFGVVPLEPGIDWRRSGEQGVGAYAGSLAPNTIVVDVDPERKAALRHRLEPGKGPG